MLTCVRGMRTKARLHERIGKKKKVLGQNAKGWQLIYERAACRQTDAIIPEVWLHDKDGQALLRQMPDVPLDVWSVVEGGNRRFFTGADRPPFRKQGPQAYSVEHTRGAMLQSIHDRGKIVSGLVCLKIVLYF